MKDDDIKIPPFETNELRKNLTKFLNSTFHNQKVGNYKYGVYAFYDYDGEPIYVGQTNEMLRTRIGRHITNQRTDAVAMSVLDPFEVFEIEVWPLTDYKDHIDACAKLNSLEYTVYQNALNNSTFGAILNEKEPPKCIALAIPPESIKERVVSTEVEAIRRHPDIRIARRASVLAKLAQVISEREVSSGLRQTLLTQAKRLQWLADRRINSLKTSKGIKKSATKKVVTKKVVLSK